MYFITNQIGSLNLSFFGNRRQSLIGVDHQMNPSFTLPFMNTQPVSPAQLLTKLSNIKISNEQSTLKLKQLRQLEQKISIYETYCMQTMQNFQQKISSMEKQVNELKKNYKKAQNLGVANFDQLETLLQNTLNEYEKDRNKGSEMIEKLVQEVQQQLEKSVIQKSLQCSQLCEDYLRLNTRLQSVIQSLQSMQLQLLNQYSVLKRDLHLRFSSLERSILEDINQTEKEVQLMLQKLQKLQLQCEQQIDRINEKKQTKRYQLHEMMQKMIQEAVDTDEYYEQKE